jgi:C-terminal processing protease CtpA/Prc
VNNLGPIYVRKSPLRDGERRGYFGLQVDEERSGTFILAVVPGSPAERAGIRANDEITRIDGADVTGANGYQFWLRVVARVGQVMVFELRDGRVLRMIAEPLPLEED